jgi:hypothetical protein
LAEKGVGLPAGDKPVGIAGLVPVDSRRVSRRVAKSEATAVDTKSYVYWAKERVLKATRVWKSLEVIVVLLFAYAKLNEVDFSG